MAKMLNSKVINVTSFAWLHLGEQNVVELRNAHWSNLVVLFLTEFKDIEVIKLAEIIETTVEACNILIRLAKMFSVCSKALQNISFMEGPNRSVQDGGGGVGVITSCSLHVCIDLVPVVGVRVHEVVVLPYELEIVFISPQHLKSCSGSSIFKSGWITFCSWLAISLPVLKLLLIEFCACLIFRDG